MLEDVNGTQVTFSLEDALTAKMIKRRVNYREIIISQGE
jgi:hypothetical protein